MVSQALYRKYRSKSLTEVVGQNHITDMLSRALAAGKIAHAYLFTGPRGVGKTSIARILAHEINNLPYTEESTHLDIIEIDAASNNGIDDVRDLREKAQIAPTSAPKKVYIIDEVHMLSKPAFNALLKTLEEPPEHVVFILATTDVEKLPATIISRTQRYAFRAIRPADATAHLKAIAQKEGILLSDDALALIAERGDGSFRDSISLLDQLSSITDGATEITTDLIEATLGLAPTTLIDSLIKAVDSHDIATLATLLTNAESDGINPVTLADQLTRALSTRIQQKPHSLVLIDALLDVAKSTQPAMKLLSVLGSAALEHKPKNAALATPVLEVSASVEALTQQTAKPATQTQPVKKSALQPAAQPVAPPAATPAVVASGELDWPAVIEHTRQHYLALYSVLSKCDHELNDTTLTIYCINAFYKKKLDDPKYHTSLYDSLSATGVTGLTIETIPTRAPMKNSQAAAIADIMGGGVEVSPAAAV